MVVVRCFFCLPALFFGCTPNHAKHVGLATRTWYIFVTIVLSLSSLCFYHGGVGGKSDGEITQSNALAALMNGAVQQADTPTDVYQGVRSLLVKQGAVQSQIDALQECKDGPFKNLMGASKASVGAYCRSGLQP